MTNFKGFHLKVSSTINLLPISEECHTEGQIIKNKNDFFPQKKNMWGRDSLEAKCKKNFESIFFLKESKFFFIKRDIYFLAVASIRVEPTVGRSRVGEVGTGNVWGR